MESKFVHETHENQPLKPIPETPTPAQERKLDDEAIYYLLYYKSHGTTLAEVARHLQSIGIVTVEEMFMMLEANNLTFKINTK